MVGDASAYAALGLEPDADDASIERAYKRLIKLHHPDREGGDASRAAEINRAYRELRDGSVSLHPLILADDEPSKARGKGRIKAVIILIVGIAVLLFRPTAAYMRRHLPNSGVTHPDPKARPAAKAADPMDQPLHLGAINSAVRQAIGNERNPSALLSASRECHRVLRQDPSPTQLDRCAAFDDAVVQLQNREPMWDQSPFSELSVTGRQWSAAKSLSNDYLAIDSRLNRIRVQVDLALASPAPQPEPTMANSD